MTIREYPAEIKSGTLLWSVLKEDRPLRIDYGVTVHGLEVDVGVPKDASNAS